MFKADSHNFGRQVQTIYLNGLKHIQKPRTVYWEYQLLDSSSPIRTAYREILRSNALNVDEVLGHTPYVTENSFDSGVCDFIAASAPFPSPVLAANMGKLLAFCWIHGITDLHAENVAFEADRPRLLDIEVIFSSTRLPSETLLIPSNLASREMCGFRTGLNAFQDRNMLWSTLIDAFLDASVFIAGKSLSLAKAWEGLAQDLSCTPVRILLRNSREYATASDLIPAEAAQVSRGDVPYFFGFLGQKSIFYHSTTAELDVVELGSQETMLLSPV